MGKDTTREIVVISKTYNGQDPLYLQRVDAGNMVWTNNPNEAKDFGDAATVTAAVRDLNKLLVSQYRPALGTEIFSADPRQVIVAAERLIIKKSPILTATFMKK